MGEAVDERGEACIAAVEYARLDVLLRRVGGAHVLHRGGGEADQRLRSHRCRLQPAKLPRVWHGRHGERREQRVSVPSVVLLFDGFGRAAAFVAALIVTLLIVAALQAHDVTLGAVGGERGQAALLA